MYEGAGEAAPDVEQTEESAEQPADDEATVEGEYREVNNER